MSENGPWANDTVSYTYNNRQRSAVSVQAPNASPWVQSYSYDTLMRLSTATSPAGDFCYEYAGGPVVVTLDEVSSLDLPSSSQNNVYNHYDGLGRLTETTLNTAIWNSSPANDLQYNYDPGSQVTQQVFTVGNLMNYTYDNIGQLKTAQGIDAGYWDPDLGTVVYPPRLHEQFGYAYDKAWNLQARTNNALIRNFAVNNVNELTGASQSGTLTVAGTATEGDSNYVGHGVFSVQVNGQAASVYFDGTFAAAGFTPAAGNNTFTAIAQDGYGRKDTNSITAYLPAIMWQPTA